MARQVQGGRQTGSGANPVAQFQRDLRAFSKPPGNRSGARQITRGGGR